MTLEEQLKILDGAGSGETLEDQLKQLDPDYIPHDLNLPAKTVDRPGFAEKLFNAGTEAVSDFVTGADRLGGTVELADKQMVDLPPDLGGYKDIPGTTGQEYMKGLAALSSQAPIDRANMLTQIYPGTQVWDDDKGNLILFRDKTPLGYVSRPGWGIQDFLDIVNAASPYVAPELAMLKLTQFIPGALVRGGTRIGMEVPIMTGVEAARDQAAQVMGADSDASFSENLAAGINTPIGRLAGDIVGRFVSAFGGSAKAAMEQVSNIAPGGPTQQQAQILARANIDPNEYTPDMIRAALQEIGEQGVSPSRMMAAANRGEMPEFIAKTGPDANIDQRISVAKTKAFEQQFPRLEGMYTQGERLRSRSLLATEDKMRNLSTPENELANQAIEKFDDRRYMAIAATLGDVRDEIAGIQPRHASVSTANQGLFDTAKTLAKDENTLVGAAWDKIPQNANFQIGSELKKLVGEKFNRDTLTSSRPTTARILGDISDLNDGQISQARYIAIKKDINDAIRSKDVKGGEKAELGKIKDAFEEYEENIVKDIYFDGEDIADVIRAQKNATLASKRFAKRWLPQRSGGRGTSYKDIEGDIMASLADDKNLTAENFYANVFGSGKFGANGRTLDFARRLRKLVDDKTNSPTEKRMAEKAWSEFRQVNFIKLFGKKAFDKNGVVRPAGVIDVVREAADPNNVREHALWNFVFTDAERRKMLSLANALEPMTLVNKVGNPPKTSYRLAEFGASVMNTLYAGLLATGDFRAIVPIAYSGVKPVLRGKQAARMLSGRVNLRNSQYEGMRAAFPAVGGAYGAGYGTEMAPLQLDMLNRAVQGLIPQQEPTEQP